MEAATIHRDAQLWPKDWLLTSAQLIHERRLKTRAEELQQSANTLSSPEEYFEDGNACNICESASREDLAKIAAQQQLPLEPEGHPATSIEQCAPPVTNRVELELCPFSMRLGQLQDDVVVHQHSSLFAFLVLDPSLSNVVLEVIALYSRRLGAQ